MVVFPGFQMLDAVGPLEVFSSARRLLEHRGQPSPYAVTLLAHEAGPVRSSGGLAVVADAAFADAPDPLDTLLVSGGDGVYEAAKDPALLRWLSARAGGVRRLGSVCTGSFLLAEAGLLDGREATTHWSRCAALARRYPEVRVQPDAIFVRSGDVWTSAGVTAGMDLALALVEADLGREVALEVARWLVVFLKRPGGQSQFSAQLAGQLAEQEGLRALQTFILEHPGAELSVAALARRAGMSPRNFARRFKAEIGTTPMQYVQQARVDAARRQLEQTRDGVEAIAAACGFGTAETLRRAFLRTLNITPTEYRRLHAADRHPPV